MQISIVSKHQYEHVGACRCVCVCVCVIRAKRTDCSTSIARPFKPKILSVNKPSLIILQEHRILKATTTMPFTVDDGKTAKVGVHHLHDKRDTDR